MKTPPVHAEQIAYSAMHRALKSGELKRASNCEECGASPRPNRALDGHHEDYSKPLDVVWLCSRCHRAKHPTRMRRRDDEQVLLAHKAALEAFLARLVEAA